jgi:hypothetical protein
VRARRVLFTTSGCHRQSVQDNRRGDVLEKRRALMQAWAHYIVGAQNEKVVRISLGRTG